MNRDSLIQPMEFRFTAPEDVEKYGPRWRTYDELAICSLPARVLMALEQEIGTPLADVMDGFRKDSVWGDTVAAWLAIRLEESGPELAFAEFNPAILLAEWRPAASPGKAPAEDSAPADSPASPRPMDTVALPTMPAAG